MQLFGITWLGLTPENARKLVVSVILIAGVLTTSAVLRAVLGRLARRAEQPSMHVGFWTRQVIALVATAAIVIGLLSIWFSNPSRLATAFGLMSAGLAFALQQVVTAIAGYFVILRGTTFRVGDRISMGGVRGDVMALGFVQTTVMEMGQPHGAPNTDHATWIRSRQFTGRIVVVSNARIFSEPVFNYTRDFPYIWEELTLPIPFDGDCERVEAILLEASREHAIDPDGLVAAERDRLQARFGIGALSIAPRVYWRVTSNWMELGVRFLSRPHGSRDIKDKMSRDVHRALRAAGIAVAAQRVELTTPSASAERRGLAD